MSYEHIQHNLVKKYCRKFEHCTDKALLTEEIDAAYARANSIEKNRDMQKVGNIDRKKYWVAVAAELRRIRDELNSPVERGESHNISAQANGEPALHTEENTMTDYEKNMKEFSNMLKHMMPQFKPSKNGYEIRLSLLNLAQTQEWQPFMLEANGLKVKTEQDGDEVVTTVEYPTVEDVLETAKKMYDFVRDKDSE